MLHRLLVNRTFVEARPRFTGVALFVPSPFPFFFGFGSGLGLVLFRFVLFSPSPVPSDRVWLPFPFDHFMFV